MDLQTLFSDTVSWTGLKSWVVQVFVVVFLTLLLDAAQRIVLRRLYRRLEQTSNIWDDALVDALRKPLTLLVWIVGLAFAMQIIRHETQAEIFAAVQPLRDVGVIVALTWFLVRVIRNTENNLLSGGGEDREQRIDSTTLQALGRLLRVSVIITAALVMLQTLGFSISGVLAFGGIGGIAVGFAARDLLANFFGGLMLYLDRPFTVGDWVRSPDRDIEGHVEHIGWRLTCIRTFDKRPIYVPNSVFSTIAVENPSRMTHRRIYETVGVRYDDADKLAAIIAAVREMLLARPDIDQSQLLMVNFNSFGASSLDFFVYAFTRTTVWPEYHQVKEQVLIAIHDIIAAHGAEVAFPTRTLHVPDQVRVAQAETEQQ